MDVAQVAGLPPGSWVTSLAFDASGDRLALTLRGTDCGGDAWALDSSTDVHGTLTRTWSRWTESELGGIPRSRLCLPRYHPALRGPVRSIASQR